MYEQPLEKKFHFSQHPDAEDCETLLPNSQNSLHNGDYPRRLLPSYLLTSFIILFLLLTWTLSFWLGSQWQSGPSLWAQQITNYCTFALLTSQTTSNIPQHRFSTMFLSHTLPHNSTALFLKKTFTASLQVPKWMEHG